MPEERLNPAFLSPGCNDFHRFAGPFYRLKTAIGWLLFYLANFRNAAESIAGNLIMQPKKRLMLKNF